MANYIQRLSLRTKIVSLVVIIAFIVVLIFVLVKGSELTPVEAMKLAGIEQPQQHNAALIEGEVWKPSGGSFTEGLVNEHYALYVNAENSQINVLEKATRHRWNSNPTAEQLAEETIKGQLLENLQSPFVLTYVKTTGKDQTIRQVVNSLSKGVETSFVRNEDTLQVNYKLVEQNLEFSLQYELTNNGLKARIPTDGIKENGEFSVFSIDLLPYFGAVKAGEDGYLFVPDGPGGLIYFDDNRVSVSTGYIHQVYGLEVTNMNNWSRSGERREDISYPVFGVKHGEQAFVAILSNGGDSAVISAMPPGAKSSLYNIFSGHLYREEFLYQVSRMAVPIKAIQKERLQTDREVEFRFLNGEDASYVGMAQAYRSYLEEQGNLTAKLDPVQNIPLYLKIMGGNYEEAFNGVRYATATTFPQASEIVNRLVGKGISNMEIIYYGWQYKGDYDMYKRFPIEPSLGGEKEARNFIGEMQGLGFPVIFEDDFVWINEKQSTVSGKGNGIQGIDGTVYVDEGWFINRPDRTVTMAYETIQKLKEMGVSGIMYNWLGEMVFNDYDTKQGSSRSDTISVYEGLLKYTRNTLGKSGVYRGNDYSLKDTNFILGMPNGSSYDFMIDETVPFYPIAIHGNVSYTFGDGNLRNNVQDEFLKAIEYGALPSFFLTYEDSRILKYSASNFLFSSQYDKWLDWIQTEYESFNKLAHVYNLSIINHERVSPNKYATTYEDGTQVIVDYGQKTFHVDRKGGT
ncbi:DUF5696 domain-containing protein [Paenibacillus sp. FA6]|uniref:DUF5696 domain-containing protein n=1 Tax=Paenibacillus sp. FA6 TaxID=3413029 RepID=UPI003F65D066